MLDGGGNIDVQGVLVIQCEVGVCVDVEVVDQGVVVVFVLVDYVEYVVCIVVWQGGWVCYVVGWVGVYGCQCCLVGQVGFGDW